jgi:hypothetical protein
LGRVGKADDHSEELFGEVGEVFLGMLFGKGFKELRVEVCEAFGVGDEGVEEGFVVVVFFYGAVDEAL